MPSSLLVASNRGPLSFRLGEDGGLTGRRGGGGLVSAFTTAGRETRALWVCCALSDADRLAARSAPDGRLDLSEHDTGGLRVRMLADSDGIDTLTFGRAYNGVANSTLWFLHHQLYATATSPTFDSAFRREWESFVVYGDAFARALAESAAPGAKVLVQDYHLTLTPRQLRERRPDLRIAHFCHTPWAPVEYFGLLPHDVARDVLLGMLGADHAGFLAPRWAAAFLDCCEHVLGADVDRAAGTVTYAGRTTRVAVHALGIDVDELRERAGRPDVVSKERALRAQIGDCKVVARVDRTELSKNIVRGLLAYRELLRRHPEWRRRVVHVAGAYPSRHDLPEYREYTAHVLRVAGEIEDEFGEPGWRPLMVSVEDDFARSLATYRVADVLLVNPVRDGMNLVAKEGPALSDPACALVLSTEAGAAFELGEHALLINPYDVSATAEALHRALSMSAEERARRASGILAAACALPPQQWFADQVDALDV